MDLKVLLSQIKQESKTVNTDKIRKLLKEEEKRIDNIRDLLWLIDIQRKNSKLEGRNDERK